MKYGRPRIAWSNYATKGTVVPSTEQLDYPAANIIDSQSGKVWRSSGYNATTERIIGVLPSLLLVDCYALLGLNIGPSTGSVQIDLYANNTATGTPLHTKTFSNFSDVYGFGAFGYSYSGYSSGDGYGRDWARDSIVNFIVDGNGNDAPISIQSWAITLTDPNIINTGWFEIGTFFLGDSWRPKYGVSTDVSYGYQADGLSSRSTSGFLATEQSRPYRTITLPLQLITESEAAIMQELSRATYSIETVLVSVYPNDTTTDSLISTIVGRLTAPITFTHDVTGRYKTSISIEEAK